MTGLRSEDHATIGYPAYALRQVKKISRCACERKPKLLCFPHSSTARVLVLNGKMGTTKVTKVH